MNVISCEYVIMKFLSCFHHTITMCNYYNVADDEHYMVTTMPELVPTVCTGEKHTTALLIDGWKDFPKLKYSSLNIVEQNLFELTNQSSSYDQLVCEVSYSLGSGNVHCWELLGLELYDSNVDSDGEYNKCR